MCSAWGGVPTDREKRKFVVATDLGRIVVCNVVDGHAEGHLMKIDVKQYFEWWIDLCVHQRLRSITKVLAAMCTLRNGRIFGFAARNGDRVNKRDSGSFAPRYPRWC